jgi:cephalosporin hydroxylase
MNKLSNALWFTGLSMIAINLFARATDYFDASGNILEKIPSDAALMLSGVVVLVGAITKLAAMPTAQKPFVRDVRLFFWLGAILVIGLGGFSAAKEITSSSEGELVEEFQKLYHKKTMFHSHYLGVESDQFPTDNWVMQEIISELKPDVIIETGTAKGGTALFYATVLDQLGKGKVITVDIEDHDPKVRQFDVWNERVHFIKGSSTSREVFDRIQAQVNNGARVLVTLDSEHTKEHVLRELQLYSELVSLNSYLIVQDTHLNGHPVPWPRLEKTGGPMEALREFLKTSDNFAIDRSREKHLVTQNPSGFLKRVS